jgi:hypothetical protein
METTNNSESGKSQDGGTQNGQSQKTKETTLITNFLEYGYYGNGKHMVSAIIKTPGEKRGTVAARIFVDFSDETPRRATYTAKDAEGNKVFEPTGKLWELKKQIKDNAAPLFEKALLAKRAPVKENSKKKEDPTIEEHENNAGTGRAEEIKNTRQNKVEKDKGAGLER